MEELTHEELVLIRACVEFRRATLRDEALHSNYSRGKTRLEVMDSISRKLSGIIIESEKKDFNL